MLGHLVTRNRTCVHIPTHERRFVIPNHVRLSILIDWKESAPSDLSLPSQIVGAHEIVELLEIATVNQDLLPCDEADSVSVMESGGTSSITSASR